MLLSEAKQAFLSCCILEQGYVLQSNLIIPCYAVNAAYWAAVTVWPCAGSQAKHTIEDVSLNSCDWLLWLGEDKDLIASGFMPLP